MTDQPPPVPSPDPFSDRPATEFGARSGATYSDPFADPFAAPPGAYAEPGPASGGRRVPVWVAVLAASVALGVGAGSAAVAVWSYEHRDDVTATVERLGVPASGTLYIGELEPGVCFDTMPGDAGEDVTGDVRARSCTEPHDFQAYATFNLPDRAWAGYDALEADVDARCQRERSRNVALAKVTGEDQVTWWTPTEESWADGDHYVICAVQGSRSKLLAPVPIA